VQRSEFPNATPLESLLESAKFINGLVYDLDEVGFSWLQTQCQKNPNLRVQLIVGLYPACRTTVRELYSLSALSQAMDGRADFHLKILSDHVTPLWTALLIFTENARQYTYLGPSPNLGINADDSSHLNLVFLADPSTNSLLVRWFDDMWAKSSALTDETINLPALVPAQGTVEAQQQWETYTACFTPVESNTENFDSYYDPPEPLEPAQIAADPKAPLSVQLGLPPLDRLAERVACLYELGQLATIDKQSGSRPLDAPMKAEWFGIKSLRRRGSITRETRYRISAFDQDTWAEIVKHKKAAGPLLARFSFQLNDGVHWMPRAAQTMFEQELTRVSEEGQQLIADVLQNDVAGFLENQRSRIERDANEMYQEFAPGKTLDKQIIYEIIHSLNDRLVEAIKNGLLPQISYNRIQFETAVDSRTNSQWGQALTLLLSIAQSHRKAITESQYFYRGLHVPSLEYSTAMNVCGDKIVMDAKTHNLYDRAKAELDFMGKLKDAGLAPKPKCRILFDLMDGVPVKDLNQRLEPADKST